MIPYGGPYVCRGCGVHHTGPNPCETPPLPNEDGPE